MSKIYNKLRQKQEKEASKPVEKPVIKETPPPFVPEKVADKIVDKANDQVIDHVNERISASISHAVPEKEKIHTPKVQVPKAAVGSSGLAPNKPMVLIAGIVVCVLVLIFFVVFTEASRKGQLAKMQELVDQQQQSISALEDKVRVSQESVSSSTIALNKEVKKQLDEFSANIDQRFNNFENVISKSLTESKEAAQLVGDIRIKVDGLKLQYEKLRQKVADVNALQESVSSPIIVK